MISDTRTSAPRSSVIHAVDGRPGVGGNYTRCGRTIGERWAGEYDAQPAGDVTCARCIKGCASDQAELEERARLVREGIDQEVAQLASLLTGNPWTPRLVSRLTDDEILAHHREAERAAAMRRHPAGKGRGHNG